MHEHINYKQFTEEEGRIYMKGIEMIRATISDGVKFDLACDMVTIEDSEIKGLIIDDALKIEIAELHFGKGLTLREVSKRLGVSVQRLMSAREEMLEDIMNTARASELMKYDGGHTFSS
jgi:hypothetical protein